MEMIHEHWMINIGWGTRQQDIVQYIRSSVCMLIIRGRSRNISLHIMIGRRVDNVRKQWLVGWLGGCLFYKCTAVTRS